MTVNKYLTLKNSNNTLTKQFHVIMGGYRTISDKTVNAKKTLVEGEYDIAEGGVFERHEYMIRVHKAAPDANTGDLDDLKVFYSYNKPNGTPSSKITFTDHYGASRYVKMAGEFVPENLTVFLDGQNAIFVVKVILLFLPGVVP